MQCEPLAAGQPHRSLGHRPRKEMDACGCWPKANLTVAWGNAPGNGSHKTRLAEGQTHLHPGSEHTMPQSLTKLYAHLVFSTKNRQPFLCGDVQQRVHGYLATVIRSIDSPYVVVGGVADHVHILFDMGKMHAPVEFVERVKRESSKFIKALGPEYRDFYWQRGYGMFSVSPTHLEDAEAYVRNQDEHHRKKSFQEEVRELLQRYRIEFDERYVWD